MGLEPCRKEDTKAMKVIEKEEDVLEVFVDAVDDQNLLASVQEKYDQGSTFAHLYFREESFITRWGGGAGVH